MPTMMKWLFSLVAIGFLRLSNGFIGETSSRVCHEPLSALTERQMQFWEDVEEGLDDIEAFYAKQGLDIDRIRRFGKR